MAWQLIYTSAPRLLEAGHSGFGTVARHRQMSPLLVSAIERVSQFARQPGLDPHRIVFAHRIVTVAGGRFHVLSCIRDAGADYTGRTNHIAHHLIAEPREIARLGANGASPADILLAMPWCSAWNEHPRHLESADEIALDHFTPQTAADGVHWAGVTGSASHAWLLANGEASRGAYLIVPAGTDLRPLFAESLRLVPERAWQNGFITSLQPSDDPSDFRWIALEASSPLRPQAESSGRPTLDLTAPHTLPVGEIPRPVRASVPTAELTHEGPQLPQTAAFGPTTPGLRTETNDPFQNFKPTRRLPWAWIGAGAGAAILAAGAVAFMALRGSGERQIFEGEIDRVLGSESREYFSEQTKADLKSVPPELRPSALELAGAGRDLVRAKKSATGEGRDDAMSRAANAAARLQAKGRNVPAQISDLVRQAQEAPVAVKAAPLPAKISAEPKPATPPETPKTPGTAENKPPPEARPADTAKPMTPLYFVNAQTPVVQLDELSKGLTYFLRAPVAAEPVRLVGPSAQGGLRRNMTESQVFTVDETARTLTLLRANGAPAPPFVFLARDAAGREIVQLWMVAETSTPLLPRRTAGVTRTGHLLVLDPAKLGFSGTPKTPLRLLLPEEYGIPGTKNEALPVTDWKADFGPRKLELEKRRETTAAEIKRLEAALVAKPVAEPTAEFREKKKTIATVIKRDIEAWKIKADKAIDRDGQLDENGKKDQHRARAKEKKEKEGFVEANLAESKTLIQEFGSCLVALCVDADFRERDALYTLGMDLRAMSEKAELKEEVALLGRTQRKIQDAIGQLPGAPESKTKYETALKDLDAMVRMITPDNPETIARRAREQEMRTAELRTRREEQRLLAAHPLLAPAAPPAVVGRLLAVAGGAEIPLLDVEFAW